MAKTGVVGINCESCREYISTIPNTTWLNEIKFEGRPDILRQIGVICIAGHINLRDVDSKEISDYYSTLKLQGWPEKEIEIKGENLDSVKHSPPVTADEELDFHYALEDDEATSSIVEGMSRFE